MDPQPIDPTIKRLYNELTPDQQENFNERAAILEYDAGLTRVNAERQAMYLLTKKASGEGIRRQ